GDHRNTGPDLGPALAGRDRPVRARPSRARARGARAGGAAPGARAVRHLVRRRLVPERDRLGEHRRGSSARGSGAGPCARCDRRSGPRPLRFRGGRHRMSARHVVLITYGEPPTPSFTSQLRYSWRILLGLTRAVASIPAWVLPMIAVSRARTRHRLWSSERYRSPLESITRAQAELMRESLAAESPLE